MFRKIADSAQLAHYRSVAKKSGLVCPSCSALARVIPEAADQVITCSSCGTKATIHEWTPKEGSIRTGDADSPPTGTKITKDASISGTTIWKIPASGKSGGLLFFAICWCAITGIVSGGFLMAFLLGEKMSGDFPGWLLIPFFGIFWAAGLGMFYAAFRNKFARLQLTVDSSAVTLRRELFGRTKDITLPVSGITSVSQVQFYQQNYQPVHGIEIRGTGGKIRFGSILTDEEKAWLVADLRRTILSPALKMATARKAAPVVRQSYFSIVIPHSRRGLLHHAVIMTLMGISFIAIGNFLLCPGSHTKFDVFERMLNGLDLGFRVIWLGMSSLITLGGLTLFGWLLRAKGVETRLEGNDSEIAIRTFKHGLVIKERSYPRASVTDFRTAASGYSSDRIKKRIEMIVGEKAETLAHWVDEEQADGFAAEARAALG